MTLKETVRNAWKGSWVKKLAIGTSLLGAGGAAAGVVGYHIERDYGIIQKGVAERVLSAAGNRKMGNLWEDHNEIGELRSKMLTDNHGFQPGVDYPGNDIADFRTKNVHSCSAACEAEKKCSAFSFNKGHCFLKEEVSNPVPYKTATSGVKKRKDIRPEPVNLREVDSVWDLLSSDVDWAAEFPDYTVLDKYPFVKDNRVHIVTADKKPLTLVDRVTRMWVPIEKIPEEVQNAFILKEDRNFYEHYGINMWGKVRALKSFLATGKIRTAGSGLTEQLAKMVMTPRNQLPYRSGVGGVAQKVKEMAFATGIEQHFMQKYRNPSKAKKRILELYLNLAFFGDRNYGIGSAARNYFKKDASKLTEQEALFLSVLPRNPGRNPVKKGGFNFHFGKFEKVVTNLARQGELTNKEREQYASEATKKYWMGLFPKGRKNSVHFPSALNTFYAELAEKHDFDVTHLIDGSDADPPYGFSAKLTASRRMTKDLQRSVLRRFKKNGAQTGSVVLNQDAAIVAILGQTNNQLWSNLNYATRADEGLASTIKTILMAIAIEEGVIDRYSSFNDTCEALKDWCPRNYDRKDGRVMTVERALATSNNRIFTKVYTRIARKIGTEGFANYMGEFGFDGDSFLEAARIGPAVALGPRGGSPTDLAAAYRVLATGNYREPTIIKDLSFGGVRPVFVREEAKSRNVLSSSTVKEVKLALGKAGRKYAPPGKNIYVGLKTGTATKHHHLFLAAYFMPRAQNHELYSMALMAVPEPGKKTLGRNAYASNILGPVAKDFFRQFARQAPQLTQEQLADFHEEEEFHACQDLFYQYAPQVESFLETYDSWGTAGREKALTNAVSELAACQDMYDFNTNGALFFELSKGVAAQNAARAINKEIDPGFKPYRRFYFWEDDPKFEQDKRLWEKSEHYKNLSTRALMEVSYSGPGKFSNLARRILYES